MARVAVRPRPAAEKPAAEKPAAARAREDAGHPIIFDPALSQQGADAVRVWAGAIRAFARTLAPRDRAAFLMALDGPLYEEQGFAAIAAGLHGGLHPKHALTRYHDFFVCNIRPGEHVLDLGCGVGALALSVAQRSGAHVTGIDWTQANLIKARGAAHTAGLSDHLSYHEGDITTLRVPGMFDAIILSNVLEHLTDRPQRLAQWRDWYRPSRFLIRVPAFDRDWRVPWKQELGVEWRLDETHETEYTRSQLCDELLAAGLIPETLTATWGEYWVVAVPVGPAAR